MKPTASPPLSAADREALRVIVQRLLESPGALDSAGGIARFWLGDPALGERRVRRALDVLHAAGQVERLQRLDGSVQWRRAHGCSDAELRAWLQPAVTVQRTRRPIRDGRG